MFASIKKIAKFGQITFKNQRNSWTNSLLATENLSNSKLNVFTISLNSVVGDFWGLSGVLSLYEEQKTDARYTKGPPIEILILLQSDFEIREFLSDL